MIDMPFELQMILWKCDTQGDILEFSACIAENTETSQRAWDRTGKYLDTIVSTRLGYRVEVPMWWALPWVVEHQLRKEMAA